MRTRRTRLDRTRSSRSDYAPRARRLAAPALIAAAVACTPAPPVRDDATPRDAVADAPPVRPDVTDDIADVHAPDAPGDSPDAALVDAAFVCPPRADAGAPAVDAGAGCTAAMRAAGECPLLSQYGLFRGELAAQQPADRVVPYDVVAPLFADFAAKHRFIALPPGGQIAFHPTERWTVPEGTILVKTFSYARDACDGARGAARLLETRLLVRTAAGFNAVTYVWNDAQTDATRAAGGATLPGRWVDDRGDEHAFAYLAPNRVRCGRCHGQTTMDVIGLRTRQLERDYDYGAGPENQIDHLARLGLLAGAVPPSGMRERMTDPSDARATVEARARAYLEANCAHCHNSTAPASWSGLHLDLATRDATALGVCKIPSSAGDTGGLRYDIVPGEARNSVLIYRMGLVDSPYRMPENSQLPDRDGVALLSRWIDAMSPAGCPR